MLQKGMPNILFIVIDDMGWKDLSCYGSSFYETPNLDKLAKEGMCFTDAYAACPVCSPTRASIMTGKYPANIEVTNYIAAENEHPSKGKLIDAPYIDHLPLEEKSLAAALREGGYQTWHVGKWHLGGRSFYPDRHGFDVNIAGSHWGRPSPYGIETLEDGPEGEYLTDRLTDEAIKLIRTRDKSRPFFLNLWYYAVHTPIECKEEYIKKYQKKKIEAGYDKVDEFEEGEHFPCDHKKHLRVKRRIIQSDPVYAAMVENLDANIGYVLNTVKEAGLEKEMLIIFTSDNGGLSTAEGSPTCNAPLSEGKGWMYEGGVRVPLIIKWPEIVKGGSVCSVPVTSPDFYPTFLDAAGLPPNSEQHADGISLLPLLEGGNSIGREATYWHYPHYGNQGGTPGSSIRMGDYKLIEFFEDGHTELYNLNEDMSEENDISGIEPERVRIMREMLAKWREVMEAKIPEKNPGYE